MEKMEAAHGLASEAQATGGDLRAEDLPMSIERLTPELIQYWAPCNYLFRMKSDHPNFFPWELKMGLDREDSYFNRIVDSPRFRGVEASLMRSLRERGIDAPVLTLRQLDDKSYGLLVLRVPYTEEETNSSCHRDIRHRLVGCILDGRIYRADEVEGLYDTLCERRNTCWRRMLIGERRLSLEPEEKARLWEESTRYHQHALLVGFLTGRSPQRCQFEIALGLGSVKIGDLTCARVAGSGEVEITLPAVEYHFNMYTYGRGEERGLHHLADNLLFASAALGRKKFEAKLCELSGSNDLRVESSSCIASHRWEGVQFETTVIRFPSLAEEAVMSALEKLQSEGIPREKTVYVY